MPARPGSSSAIRQLSRLRDQRRNRALGNAADRYSIERDRRGPRAPVRGVYVDGVIEEFERKPGGFGRLLGENHRARPRVEHHWDARPVDLRGKREASAAAARDLDGSSLADRPAGDELGEHLLTDVAQFEPVRVPKHQQQYEHDPEQGRFQHIGEAPAKQRQSHYPSGHKSGDLDAMRGDIEVCELGQCGLVLSQHQDEQGDSQDGEQNQEQPAHEAVLTETGRQDKVHPRERNVCLSRSMCLTAPQGP